VGAPFADPMASPSLGGGGLLVRAAGRIVLDPGGAAAGAGRLRRGHLVGGRDGDRSAAGDERGQAEAGRLVTLRTVLTLGALGALRTLWPVRTIAAEVLAILTLGAIGTEILARGIAGRGTTALALEAAGLAPGLALGETLGATALEALAAGLVGTAIGTRAVAEALLALGAQIGLLASGLLGLGTRAILEALALEAVAPVAIPVTVTIAIPVLALEVALTLEVAVLAALVVALALEIAGLAAEVAGLLLGLRVRLGDGRLEALVEERGEIVVLVAVVALVLDLAFLARHLLLAQLLLRGSDQGK